MPNLELLARIAGGERAFHVAPRASADERAAFDQLVCDVRHLTALGYTGSLRAGRHADDDGPPGRSLEILSPGITTAGTAALRRAGLDITGEFAGAAVERGRDAPLEPWRR
jgi:hypothetical protein